MVHLRHGAHVRAVHLALFDMAARGNNGRFDDGLAPDLHAAHKHAPLHLGAGMHLHAHLQVGILNNHGIVHVRRFLERTQDYRIADLGGPLYAGMRANPAVADNVRVAHHGTLAHHSERECHLGAELLQLLVERRLHIGFGLVEKLHVDKVRGNVREHAHAAPAHLVTHGDGRPYHVVYLAAAHQRADILDNGTAAHEHIAEHRHLVHERVLDYAVAHEAIVHARRERHVARQKERPVKARELHVAHENRIPDTGRVEIRLDLHAVPVLAPVAVTLEGGNLFGSERTELSARGLSGLDTFGQSRQNTVLQHFFQFEQSLHVQKID